MPRPARRLAVEALSDRIVPAYDLVIDGDAVTFNVATAYDPLNDATEFRSTGPGATLAVADIVTALSTRHVIVTTADTGPEPGDITWARTSAADDLSYAGPPERILGIGPSAAATGGTVTLDGVTVATTDTFTLLIDTRDPAVDADVVLTGATTISGPGYLELRAGTGTAHLGGAVGANLAVTAAAIAGGDATLTGFDVRLHGAVDLSAGGLSVRAAGPLWIDGPIDGAGDLTIGKTADNQYLFLVDGPVGATTPLTSFTVTGGYMTGSATTVAAGTVTIGNGDAADGPPAEIPFITSIITPLTGDVVVNADGYIDPAGLEGVGTLDITGNLTVAGTFGPTIGPASDAVTVSEDVTLLPGSTFGVGYFDRDTPAGVDRTVLTYGTGPLGGTLTGAFANAPAAGAEFFYWDDALELVQYGPGAVVVRPVAKAANNKATGTDAEGTKYTIKLAGPGELVPVRDPSVGYGLILRDTTARSNVTVTTTRVGTSDDRIGLSRVYVQGGLKAFAGKKVALDGVFASVDPVKSIVLASASGKINIQRGIGSKTAVTLGTGDAEISTGGALSLTTTGNFGGRVRFADLVTAKVGGTLSGSGEPWNVNVITSLRAAEIRGLDVRADSIGTLTAAGGGPGKVAGDIIDSTFFLTGASRGPLLKTLTAKGTVQSSRFVVTGNVGSVTVGRFIDSRLYLSYSAGTDFTTGHFHGPGHLGKFTTTAKVLGDPAHPLNWSFAGSEVAAVTFGTVRLSGLKTDNGGVAFGFKFWTDEGSVRTTTSDVDVALIPRKTNLTPDTDGTPTALAGDFFYIPFIQ